MCDDLLVQRQQHAAACRAFGFQWYETISRIWNGTKVAATHRLKLQLLGYFGRRGQNWSRSKWDAGAWYIVYVIHAAPACTSVRNSLMLHYPEKYHTNIENVVQSTHAK